MSNTAVFLDTSIQISRVIRSPELKRKIEERLKRYSLTITGEIVKQEYKRRLLKEALYLLNQFTSGKSYHEVLRHVTEHLPPQQNRKRNICLGVLETVLENASEMELTERATLYLRSLLKTGLALFSAVVGHVMSESACACARRPILERRGHTQFDFGTDSCNASERCEIAAFIEMRRSPLQAINDYLAGIDASDKSREIQNAESAIGTILKDPTCAPPLEPCLKLGDLFIALESATIGTMYTLNSKESRHFCHALRQSLVVRPNNAAYDDKYYDANAETWTIE